MWRTAPAPGSGEHRLALSAGEEAAAEATSPPARVAEANHEGWPRDECLKMDKGPAGDSHTLIGLEHIHNWLLGGYGNDTLFAGDAGDVMWGDYHPEGQSEAQRDYIHGGAGKTGSTPATATTKSGPAPGTTTWRSCMAMGWCSATAAGVKTFVMRYLRENRPGSSWAARTKCSCAIARDRVSESLAVAWRRRPVG